MSIWFAGASPAFNQTQAVNAELVTRLAAQTRADALPKEWTTDRGVMARILLFDQFPRLMWHAYCCYCCCCYCCCYCCCCCCCCCCCYYCCWWWCCCCCCCCCCCIACIIRFVCYKYALTLAYIPMLSAYLSVYLSVCLLVCLSATHPPTQMHLPRHGRCLQPRPAVHRAGARSGGLGSLPGQPQGQGRRQCCCYCCYCYRRCWC
jgi:hypothetical protein